MSWAVRRLITTFISIAPLVGSRSALRLALNVCAGDGVMPSDTFWAEFVHQLGVIGRFSVADQKSGVIHHSYREANVRLARELLFWVSAMDHWDSFDVYGSPRDLGWCGGVQARVALSAEEVLRAVEVSRIWSRRGDLSYDDIETACGTHIAHAYARVSQASHAFAYEDVSCLRIVDDAVKDALGRCADLEVCALFGDAKVRDPLDKFDISPGGCAFWLEFMVSEDGKPAFVANAFERGGDLYCDKIKGAP